MTTPLRLVITTAGLGRFTAAQEKDDIDLTVAKVGLTDAQFVVAPSLTALPGEFRRISTISGQAASDNIVHMIVRDDAALTYQVRGFGLFLADGTLFAVYGQAEPIGQKSAMASLLLALDIAFPTSDVSNLVFGDTNFLNPPATEMTKGIVELATDQETIDGADAARAVTPSGLKAWLATIVTKFVSAQRSVKTSGLATGGSTLDADITIDVPRATAAEADNGSLTTKALTPASLANILAKLGNSVPFGRSITTTGLATGGRTLDADITIDVPRATAAEADAGVLATKAVTPSSLVNILASILARTPLTRRVDTSGLAIGGNALSTDITISVPPATPGQLLAGTAGNVAATPAALAAAGIIYLVESKSDGASRYRRFSDGFIEMQGIGVMPTSEIAFTLNFPWAFATACDGIWTSIINSGQSNDGLSSVQEVSLSPASATLFAQNHKSPTADAAGGFRWLARGR